MSALRALQEWYRSECDGDWEHNFGVKIGTLDNPGWSLAVDLVGTSLEERKFEPVAYGTGVDFHPTSDDWLVCRKEENQFRAFGGPEKLEEMIQIFLRWKDEGV